jgi:hypothetical protein
LNISGTAPPPSTSESSATAPVPATATGTSISVTPQRLENVKWILIVGLAGMMTVGAFILWKRPLPHPAGAPSVGPSPARLPRETDHRAAPTGKVEQVMAEAQQEARKRLDEVKELLVRIEMRKQAGSISDDEYARERSRAEAMLRDYLK